jgi:tRNA (uracil-5-)-methyltransferase TRM9
MSSAARVVAETVDSTVFEAKHVHSIYDSIASHFSSTRYKAWPMVRQFVESLPTGALMGDIGCGNGKNLCLRNDICGIGCDYSASLLKIAAGQRLEVFRADGLKTSFRPGVFDAAISIAVIHHFSTPERRRDAIRELLRIVRPDGGRVLIYVWAKEQPKLKGSMDSRGDVLVPWEMHKKFDADETVHGRYYHMFGAGELEGLCQEAFCDPSPEIKVVPPARIEKSYFDRENWCVILQRGMRDDAAAAAGGEACTDDVACATK